MPDDEILAALLRLEAGQKSLRVDLMARMERLADALTGVRDDIAVAMGASDAVRRTHEATREELRALHDTVYILQRKLGRVETEMRELKDTP